MKGRRVRDANAITKEESQLGGGHVSVCTAIGDTDDVDAKMRHSSNRLVKILRGNHIETTFTYYCICY